MLDAMTKLGEGGRIVVPSAFRKALGIRTGDDLIMVLENDELRIMSPRRAIERARAIVRQYIPDGVQLSETLLEDRRREAERE